MLGFKLTNFRELPVMSNFDDSRVYLVQLGEKTDLWSPLPSGSTRGKRRSNTTSPSSRLSPGMLATNQCQNSAKVLETKNKLSALCLSISKSNLIIWRKTASELLVQVARVKTLHSGWKVSGFESEPIKSTNARLSAGLILNKETNSFIRVSAQILH